MAGNNAVEIEIKASAAGAIEEIKRLGERSAAAMLAADKLSGGFQGAMDRAAESAKKLNDALGTVGNQSAIAAVTATQNKFVELGQAAGLTAEKMAVLNAQFGNQIAASQATSAITNAQRELLAMGQAAEFSHEKLREMGAGMGLSAATVDKHMGLVSASMARMAHESGMSISALQNGMRMIPMQMTDIVTSLASGMPPWMVFIQQGGQLKDTLGGTSMALRAVAEYVMGLINPFTLAAGAAGVLALAYYQGSREADNYRMALVMTGNAAGVTTSQLATMASNVGALVGTTGAAAEALAALAGTGRVAGVDLERFAEAALYAQKGLGIGVNDTAKQFAELGKSPVEASAKLNEQINYLSASTYRQIKAAADLGDKEGAAAIAQNAYAAALEERGKKMIASMGYLEKAAMGVASAAKGMWDALLDIGREDDPVAKASAAAVKLLELRDKLSRGNYGGTGNDAYDRAALESEIAGQEKLIAGIQKKSAAETAAAKAQAESAALGQKRIELDAKADNYLSPEAKAIKEANKLKNEMKDAGYSQKEINTRVGFVLQPVAAQSLQRELERLKEWQAEIVDSEKLAQSALAAEHSAGLIESVDFYGRKKQLALNANIDQQAVIELEIEGVKRSGIAQAEKASKLAGYTAELQKLSREQVAIVQQSEIDIASARQKYAQKAAQEALKDASDALEARHKLALVKDADYYANATKNEADYQEQKIRLAEEQYMLVTQHAKRGSEAELAARSALQKVERDIATERELAAKNAGAMAYQYAQGIEQSNARIEYEHTLLGATAEKRTELLALYDIEAQKLQKIREIKATVGEGEAQAKALADIEIATANAKAGKLKELGDKQWQEYAGTAESWIKTAWDALPNGAGNAAQAALAKIKKDLFEQLYKLAVQPLVLNVIANITGQAAGGGGGIGGLLGQAKDIGSLFDKGIGSIFGAGQSASQASMLAAQTDAFGAVGVELTAEAAGIGSQAEMLAAQTEGMGDAAAAMTAEALGVAEAATVAGSAMASFSAAVPYIGAAMLAYSVISGMGDNNAKSGGTYQYTQGAGIDVWRDEAGRTRLGTNAAEIGDNLIQKGIQSAADNINKILEQIGSTSRVKSLTAGAQSSSEKAEAMVEAYGVLDTGRKFGIQGEQKLNKTASPEEVIKEYQTALNQATLEAIKQASEIPKSVKDMLQKVDPRGIENDKFNEYLARIISDAQAVITEEWTGMDVSAFGDLIVGMADTSVGAAEYMSSSISESIGAAWAGRIQSQFNDAMYTGVLQPIIMTATTAGLGAAAIKEQLGAAQAAIATMRSQLGIMKGVLQSDDFKGLMEEMGEAFAGAQEPIRELQTYIPQTSKSVKSLADTASSASKDIADAAKKEADERKSLQDKLDALTMTRAELLAKEREAIAESNRSLFDSVKAREDEVRLNDALKAQADAMRGLQADLLEAQGDVVTATAMRRAGELEGLKKDFDERAALRIEEAYLQKTALEDQVNAARELQSITNSLGSKSADLRVQLLQGRGDDAGAKALKRQQELDDLLLNKSDTAAAEIKAAYAKNALLEDQIAGEARLAKAMQDVDRLQKATAADAIKLQKSVADEQVNTAKALLETVKSARRDIIGSTDVGAKMQADAAREFIRNAASTAQKTGYLPDEKALSDAIGAIKSDVTEYASAADEVFAKMMVAGDLAGLEDVAKTTLDKAQAAQKIAEDQLKALEGSNATALAAAQAAQNDAARQLTELVGIREALAAQKAIAANMDKASTVATSASVPYRAAPVEFNADLQAAAVDKFAYYTATIGSAAAVDKMLTEIRGYGYTLPESEKILGLDAGTLTDFAASVGIPAFAAGANVVPNDMLALVHQGEAIIPAPFNPYLNSNNNSGANNNNNELLAELKALREEVIALRTESARTASLLSDVTEGGSGMRVVSV